MNVSVNTMRVLVLLLAVLLNGCGEGNGDEQEQTAADGGQSGTDGGDSDPSIPGAFDEAGCTSPGLRAGVRRTVEIESWRELLFQYTGRSWP